MHAALTVPYLDTAYDQLSFTLDGPELPALAVRELRLDSGTLELRLLGASHQIRLSTPDGSLLETVACLPGRAADLPSTVERDGYRFTAEVSTPAGFAAVVTAVRDEVAVSPYGLVGVFPGDESALTALLAEPGGDAVSWRTWHAYPQTGHLVTTRTTVIADRRNPR